MATRFQRSHGGGDVVVRRTDDGGLHVDCAHDRVAIHEEFLQNFDPRHVQVIVTLFADNETVSYKIVAFDANDGLYYAEKCKPS